MAIVARPSGQSRRFLKVRDPDLSGLYDVNQLARLIKLRAAYRRQIL
jgi:hypothetical protein